MIARSILIAALLAGIPTALRIHPRPAPVLTPGQTIDRILSLPELRALGETVEARSKGEVHLVVLRDGVDPAGWDYFEIAEDHPDHIVRLATLRVSFRTGLVEAWDSLADAPLSLPDWRRKGGFGRS